jgi:hypothetical protein
MDDHAKYYRDCVRGALGTLVKGSPTRRGGFAHEPLGAKRGLSHDEAEEICADAFATLQAAGVKTLPRKLYNQERLEVAYASRGLKGPR